ncbi:putative C6 transcription factor [Aspergillus stella-maris]|uniref:putative C6 transcription factor n=1 Tax=Aspergillus stella-maris TaxID=1810926 RepID=UPI003CCCC204
MQEAPRGSIPRIGEEEDRSSAAAENIACYRCRQRKVKCDRQSPCSFCVKAGSSCSYAAAKPRERRQRVMISSSYDSKLDAISRKIDDLGLKLSRLSHEPTKSANSKPFDLAEAVKTNPDSCSSSAYGPTPASSTLGTTPNQGRIPYTTDGGSLGEAQYTPSKAAYEGESSLFAHAVFANRFLENAIETTTNAEVANEMRTVLDDLKAAIHSGNQSSDSIDKLYPLASAIPPGSTIRNLPLPPIEKVFACLRMAKENPQVATLWLGDYMKSNQFNDYFIKVASPGPATEADLMIVHLGLYWLFCECSKVVDEEMRQDCDAQALLCEANLQTVLTNLRFHQPTSMDFAYAMGMAPMYCLQKSKPSAAWNLISSAAHIVLSLGLQHNAPADVEGPEEVARKRTLFWTIYTTEKMLSLRLGRSSAFRDQDITLAHPGMERHGGNFLAELAPGWITKASIQGRIYDEIYSPGALMQPQHIRTGRARALVFELEAAMAHDQEVHDQYEARKGQVLGLDYHEIARRADRIRGLSMLTLIYRSIPPQKPSMSAFCQDCIDAARATLQEQDRCVAAITRGQERTVLLEAYINWTIAQSPFIAFIVMFCHIIETSEASDLQHLRGLVETLESASNLRGHNTCDRQRRLFKALYDVAGKYVEVKSRTVGGRRGFSRSTAPQQYPDTSASGSANDFGSGHNTTVASATTHGEAIDAVDYPNQTSLQHQGTGFLSTAFADPALGEMDMEIDFSGIQLWDWYNQNQSMMRMLEDI